MALNNSKINAPAEPEAYKPRTKGHAPEVAANQDQPQAALTLTLNGQAIRDKGEMLSLTDMWKAAGEDPNKKPADWSRKEGASFIAHVAEFLNVPHGHIETKKGGSGAGRGQTFAHWQIALAYAKYLSPAFHAACNVVIRERMEGRQEAPAALPADLAEAIERTFGITRMSLSKITEISKAMPALQFEHIAALLAADPRVAVVNYRLPIDIIKEAGVPQKGRRGFSNTVRGRLLDYCMDRGIPIRKSPETGRQMFHVDAINGWLALEGAALIRDHIDKVTGQGVLKLVRS